MATVLVVQKAQLGSVIDASGRDWELAVAIGPGTAAIGQAVAAIGLERSPSGR
jgi:hypothetical protein